ncbi:MAG: oligoendopeptidase F [Christensenellaceae bacterium]|jgi:oligoendopeptidase F|nr:oligoendopeptidase F [Christensenellaceae bacterium]
MPLKRSDVSSQRKWNLAEFFPSDDEFNQLYEKLEVQVYEFSLIKKKFAIEETLSILEKKTAIERDIERLYAYAGLKRDEDTSNTHYQRLSQLAEMLYVEYSVQASFVTPNISRFPIGELKKMLCDARYENYTVYIQDIIKLKAHILPSKQESILSATQTYGTMFSNAFSMFNNADLQCEMLTLPDGETIELTHGALSLLLQHRDRATRQLAYKKFYARYVTYSNTLAAIYSGSVRRDCTNAKLRKFKSALECKLKADNIDPIVHANLLTTVEGHLNLLKDYATLRKTALKLDELHFYDLYVPIEEVSDMGYDYDTAYDLVVDALKPLGDDYVSLLLEAKNAGWIDVEETEHKRSGAYSWGCYDAHPVVLLNHKPLLRDVFTIAHEMGHALHTYLSNKHQCYEKAGYPIFLAEIASTVNEVLLLKHLMKVSKPELKVKLLSYYIEMFQTTIFRQTMFAEFELFAHQQIESGIPLTAASLTQKHRDIYEKYYGETLKLDEETGHEWSRIPHFYSAYYVFQYATGLTSAVNIAEKILTVPNYAEKYLKMLSLGGSKFPNDALCVADIDLTTTKPFEFAMEVLRNAISELAKII